jgi:ppGpp synthetase/RelA/SpoT-type nucleotidyltranferase
MRRDLLRPPTGIREPPISRRTERSRVRIGALRSTRTTPRNGLKLVPSPTPSNESWDTTQRWPRWPVFSSKDHGSHPLQLTERIIRERTRDEALGDLRRLADSDELGGRPLAEYLADHPGRGPLFDSTPDEVNVNADGVSRKQAFIDAQKELDPVRSLGPDLGAAEYNRLVEYRNHLQRTVEPRVLDELKALAPDGASVGGRTKQASGIMDKIERMRDGHAGREPRSDYEVGDVIDAVGVRVTLPDTDSLATFYDRVREEYGTGDGGRILEIENFYAEPKSGSPAYRVIPMVVTTSDERGDHPFELQLTTRLASTAADLGHNTLYKDYHSLRPGVLDEVGRLQDEAVAIEHEETRREH